MTIPSELDIRGVILDMDGVLWKDTQPLADLPAVFARMRELKLGIILATNNATKTIDQYHTKLRQFGVYLEPWQVINSSQAVAHYLENKFPCGGHIYIVGEPSLKETLAESGFIHTDEPAGDHVLAVVAGLDRSFTFDKLRWATILIRKGLPFIGTNPDKTFPTPEGLMPGAGSVLAAIEAASGTKPIIVGKPEPLLFELAIQRLGILASQALVVGDRLDTDIAGGQAAHCRTAAVISGVTTREEAAAWRPEPDIIADDITALFF